MAKTYTEEQLNTFDKATLIQLLLMQQSQFQEINKKLQLLLEQVAVLKNNRFGKKSEKLVIENQICFMEVDGDIVFFNEAGGCGRFLGPGQKKCLSPAKKYKLYKSSINKSIHFVQRSLSSSTRG